MKTRGVLLASSSAPWLLGLALIACSTDSGSASCPSVPLYDNRDLLDAGAPDPGDERYAQLHDALTEQGLLDDNKITAYQAEALARDPQLTDEQALDEAQRRAACEYVHAYDEPFAEGSGCVELPVGYCP